MEEKYHNRAVGTPYLLSFIYYLLFKNAEEVYFLLLPHFFIQL